MTQKEYRAAIDAVRLPKDFQERTPLCWTRPPCAANTPSVWPVWSAGRGCPTSARSYLVVSRARIDGSPIQEATITDYTVTPLVAGYLPWEVNIWTLGGSASAFLRDGIVYYIYEFDSIEMFAGHTVYLAVYEGGGVPSAEVMTQAEDGSISYNPDFTAPHAIFEVPLDASKADPAAVDAFMDQFAQ